MGTGGFSRITRAAPSPLPLSSFISISTASGRNSNTVLIALGSLVAVAIAQTFDKGSKRLREQFVVFDDDKSCVIQRAFLHLPPG